MKLWFSIAIKSYKSRSVYKTNVILELIGGIFIMFMQVAIWNALYRQNVNVSATLTESITYMIISTIVLESIQLKPGSTIGVAVYSGDVSTQMVRPMGLLSQHCAHEAGRVMFKMLTYIIPSIAFAVLVFGSFSLPSSAINFALFLVSGGFGVIIFTLINTIFGYSAFWFFNNWYVSWVETALLFFFGGILVPLWFYPAQFDIITKFLPFRYINYEAINFYLGRTDLSQAVTILITQVIWILLLVALERFIWHKAQRKIIIQGG